MSDPLYTRALLRLAADAHGAGRIEGPHLHGSAHNPACGDKVELDVALESGRIAALAHETKACILTQASAAILGRDAKGLTRDEVQTLRAAVAAMLAAKGEAPRPPFDAYTALEGAASIPGRHTCVLLPFDALLSALSEADEFGSVGP